MRLSSPAMLKAFPAVASGGGGSPAGPATAVQLQSNPTGSFDASAALTFSKTTNTLTVGSSTINGAVVWVVGLNTMALVPNNAIARNIQIRLPVNAPTLGWIIQTDASDVWSYVDPTSVFSGLYDIAGAAAAAQAAAISTSETYTDAAIAALPASGSSGAVNEIQTADGSGGFTASGTTLSGGSMSLSTTLYLPSFLGAVDVGSAITALQTAVAAIQAQLAAGFTGSLAPVNSLAVTNGIVTSGS